ncbi:unnamed protein product [Bursaphelenchus okinawaensis]|uniref:carbonic anhydrase n=1 Tax=Bursaphelenchus okinawaensis TaxID=465554 RepID=A0A811KTM5_9BILA|nr:unnamed protein product [Bursaphelenchus okinawaensis]CAG9112363.1 unnamed protein product [Bursaphelenchus okinawaensis]
MFSNVILGGFEQADSNSQPSLEWESWLKGTRRFPPSDQELALNEARREHIEQKQHLQDAQTEKRAPHVASRGQGAGDLDRKKHFPAYDDIELAPGAERRDDKGKVHRLSDSEMTGLRNLFQGVLKYRATVREDLVKQFARVRDDPHPQSVMFTCMDSRILPARFTQAQVGEMFVVRNSGNMIPHAQNYGGSGYEVSVTTEPAGLELAVKRGNIHHVLVMGHSDCKAINTLYNLCQCPHHFDPASPVDHWLRKNGFRSHIKLSQMLKDEEDGVPDARRIHFAAREPELLEFHARIDPDLKFGVEDWLSQINTLQQLVHVASHGFLKDYLLEGRVHLHALWFDVYKGDMFMFSRKKERFIEIDENTAPELEDETRHNYQEPLPAAATV